MSKIYTPTKTYLSKERLDKLTKDTLSQCKEDRELALAAYKFFKDLIDANPAEANGADKALMLECLRLVQMAKKDVVKILEVFAKATNAVSNATESKNGSFTFDDLENLSNEQ